MNNVKKIVVCIVSAAVILSVLIIAGNKYADDAAVITAENQKIEFTCSGLYFYNTLQDEYDASADIVDYNFKIVAVPASAKISFKPSRKPLRVYEPNTLGNENKKLKASYNKQDGCYYLSPLYESENCSYIVVADYGIKKYVYNFDVYNKTYIEKSKSEKSNLKSKISPYNGLKNTEDISINLNEDFVGIQYMHFGFTVNNNISQNISCSPFKLEKKINGTWYSLDETDTIYDLDIWKSYTEKFPVKILPGDSAKIISPTALDLVFDISELDNLKCGTYRVILPYNIGDNEKAAISKQFVVGYAEE